MNQALQSSSLAPLIEQWARLNPTLRRAGLLAVLVAAIVGFCWPKADAMEAEPAPTPIVDAPVQLLEPLALGTLQSLAEQWSHVAISRQQDRYALQMHLNWAQLYQLAAALTDSAHHPASYRLQWSASDHTDTASTDPHFAVNIQLQSGRYRRGATGFQWVHSAQEVDEAPLNCAGTPVPQVAVMAIWPGRDTVLLQTAQGSLRLKADQLLDNTWLLSRIERDLLQFSRQPPDNRCPVEVFTVAI